MSHTPRAGVAVREQGYESSSRPNEILKSVIFRAKQIFRPNSQFFAPAQAEIIPIFKKYNIFFARTFSPRYPELATRLKGTSAPRLPIPQKCTSEMQ